MGLLPFFFLNVATTVDGKLAPVTRHFVPFGSPRDRELLFEVRAQADAVMAGARTVDLMPVDLGPGPARFRRQRLARGLREYNLRVIVSGVGSLDPNAAIFTNGWPPMENSSSTWSTWQGCRGASASVGKCATRFIQGCLELCGLPSTGALNARRSSLLPGTNCATCSAKLALPSSAWCRIRANHRSGRDGISSAWRRKPKS